MADNTDQFPKLGSVYRVSGSKLYQLNQYVANIKLNSEQTDESNMKSWRSQNISSGTGTRPWGPQHSNANAWGNRNQIHKLAKWGNIESRGGNGTSWQDKTNSQNNLTCSGNMLSNGSNLPPQSIISVSPKKGSYSSVKIDSTMSMNSKKAQSRDETIPAPQFTGEFGDSDEEIVDSDDEIVFDSDDDISVDDIDSIAVENIHEAHKKSKWFRKFFDILDRMTVEEINSQDKPWHCPACQGGTGAIDWYRGLLPLVNHAKTIKSRRARLHRQFVDILEEEFCKRRISITSAGEAYGRWEGLDDQVKDHGIVWPPMVIIMNTRFEQDENKMWTGMGNQELLDCFKSYAALKARQSYGPQGHRGISVLIFESSAAGYLEAMRLHKHFREQGRDRDAYNHCQTPFLPGGKRQLYGYLASREDMDMFNRHSPGKSRLKFEMKSYQEMVESKIKHINDDIQQLDHFKNKACKEEMKSKALKESLCKVSEKLRQATKENHVVRERIKMQHEQNKEEMDAQENFFQDQIQIIQQAIEAKEDSFEKLQQEKRERVKQSYDFEKEDAKPRVEKISSFIRIQEKEMRQFEAERDKLLLIHGDKKLVLKKKHWQEEIELEKELETELTQLMDKYASNQSP